MPPKGSARQSCKTTRGDCHQPRYPGEDLCSAHAHWALLDIEPDPYYEGKIMEGVIQPTWDYMTDVEAYALLNGRYRGDGRRLDQWISSDPIGFEL